LRERSTISWPVMETVSAIVVIIDPFWKPA
jgi:hypothetical protein